MSLSRITWVFNGTSILATNSYHNIKSICCLKPSITPASWIAWRVQLELKDRLETIMLNYSPQIIPSPYYWSLLPLSSRTSESNVARPPVDTKSESRISPELARWHRGRDQESYLTFFPFHAYVCGGTTCYYIWLIY